MADSSIRTLFEHLNLTEKAAFSLEKLSEDYVLDISVQDKTDTLAATSSNKSVRLFTYSNLATKGCIEGHTDVITGVKFANTEENILYTSSEDKTIRCWDIRSDLKKEVATLEGYEEGSNVFTSFDISCNDRVICAGCAQDSKSDDVHLLFWESGNIFTAKALADMQDLHNHRLYNKNGFMDRRSNGLLGCYSDSHQDDVTQVCFHPSKPDSLSTGSTDGLVCVFDISQSTEDDAILLTLNSESSVNRIGWHGDNLYCVTHIDTFHLWDTQKEKDILNITDLKDTLQGDDGIEYLVDGFVVNESLQVLAGTHSGTLKVLDVVEKKPTVLQTLSGGHRSTVRCCKWSNNMLVTGGEDSMLCLWSDKMPVGDKRTPKTKLKMAKKSSTRKSQPY